MADSNDSRDRGCAGMAMRKCGARNTCNPVRYCVQPSKVGHYYTEFSSQDYLGGLMDFTTPGIPGYLAQGVLFNNTGRQKRVCNESVRAVFDERRSF